MCVHCHFVVVVFLSFLLLCLIYQEGCGGSGCNVLTDPSGCIWQDILRAALAFFSLGALVTFSGTCENQL